MPDSESTFFESFWKWAKSNTGMTVLVIILAMFVLIGWLSWRQHEDQQVALRTLKQVEGQLAAQSKQVRQAAHQVQTQAERSFAPPPPPPALQMNVQPAVGAGSASGVHTPSSSHATPLSPAGSFPATAEYYPQSAQRLGEEGTASVRICVGPSGRVTSASLERSSGSATLDQAALRYARATGGHWKPAMKDGNPVSACTRLPVRFALNSF